MNPFEQLVREGQKRPGVGAVTPLQQRIMNETSVTAPYDGSKDAGKGAPTIFGIPLWIVLLGGAFAMFALPRS